MNPCIVGIDLSLTSTGVALPDGSLMTIKSRLRGIERCSEIAGEILKAITPSHGSYSDLMPHADLVVIEGYSYNSQHSHAHALGELGGIVRMGLLDYDIPWVTVPPPTMKKYATGRGDASKDKVLVAAVQRLGITPESNDEADAAWLRVMGLDALGVAVVKIPKSHRAALDAVEWPKGADDE